MKHETFAEYENLSYGNTLDNYEMMASLDLKAVTGVVMIQPQIQSAATKRRINSSTVCSLSPKKTCLGEIDQPQPSTRQIRLAKVPLDKAVEMFSPSHKALSIRLSNLFSAVLKVYKELRIRRRSPYLGMFPSLKKRQILLNKKLTESRANICRAEYSGNGIKEGHEENQIKHKTILNNKLVSEITKSEGPVNSKFIKINYKETIKSNKDDENNQDGNVVIKMSLEINKTMTESLEDERNMPTHTKKPKAIKVLTNVVPITQEEAANVHGEQRDSAFGSVCDACDGEYEEGCPKHGFHTFVENYAPITGKEDRALLTTSPHLQVAKSMIPGAGIGVWTTLGLPDHGDLEPCQVESSDESDPLSDSWTRMKERKVEHYVAAQSTAASNWFRFVNCARHTTEHNLMAFQYKNKIYYHSVKPVPPKVEMFEWYNKEDTERVDISVGSFHSRNTNHLHRMVFQCDNCNTTYTSVSYLERHQALCRGKRLAPVRVEAGSKPTVIRRLARDCDGKRTYCCQLCAYKTTKRQSMKDHLVTHTQERAHMCHVCGKSFTQTSNLVTHMRIHSEQRSYRCSQCPYTSYRSYALKRHMIHHTGEKMYACPHCNYNSAISSNITIHSRTHTGEKPYSCMQCPYRTAQKNNLSAHLKTHTGEKPFSCTMCSYEAAQRCALVSHMRTHTREEHYTCTLCSHRAAKKSDFAAHMKTHTGERYYACSHCPYRATYKYNLTKHITRKHLNK